jgi:hypothetical protein
MSGVVRIWREGGREGLTTLRVPISTCGGAWSAVTISEMKFEVIPMIAMREMDCRVRTTVKVAPRAPKFWLAILMCTEGVGFESAGAGLRGF